MRTAIILLLLAGNLSAQERVWTRVDGKKAKGAFISFDLSKECVGLRVNRKVLHMSLRHFSPEDQVWVLQSTKTKWKEYDKRFHQPLILSLLDLAEARKSGNEEAIKKCESAVALTRSQTSQQRKAFIASVRQMRSARARASSRAQAATIHANNQAASRASTRSVFGGTPTRVTRGVPPAAIRHMNIQNRGPIGRIPLPPK